ncbi:MAG: crotonobetainyl-CoA hydratase [Deltaproteobacteria bacterium]|jgi:crotonobetainyl-CoA hydratase|nr:crotonobetainyl-CoA hydratase [Deltaproteobacteria bacterium]MBW2541265.1 crotonobetainyl-CoA hydratase [Deltaproteobacteria bacterium]
MSEEIQIERRGAVMTITIDRPKANAIDGATSRALGAAFIAYRDDPELRAAIVTAAGDRFFSAGWDLNTAEEESVEVDNGPGGFAGLTELFGLRKPVIAAVNGIAAGGGFELALSCDLVLAAGHAEFLLPEVNIGIVADAGGAIRLPRRIPYHVAIEMLLTGRRMPATEAHRWGLVNRVVAKSDLLAEANALADELASKAPLAVAATKEVVDSTAVLSEQAAFELLRSGKLDYYPRMLKSEDALEGARAFNEKRTPVWRGR